MEISKEMMRISSLIVWGLGLVLTSALAQSGPTTDKPKEGYVPDAATAKAIARAVLAPVYGKDQVQKEEPLQVKLSGKIWVVTGHAPQITKGTGYLGSISVVWISKTTGAIIRLGRK